MSLPSLISGICWTIVYVCTVYRGFKDKSYGMPLVALALNFTWEFTYSFLFPPSESSIGLTIINTIWCIFDAGIVYTYFKNGHKYFEESYGMKKSTFYAVSVLAFFLCFGIMYQGATFFADLPYFKGDTFEVGKFIANYQNAAMSCLFVNMFLTRKKAGHSVEGLSFYAAVFKMIGTPFTVGISQMLSHPNDWQMISIAVLTCAIFDIWYVVLLWKELKAQGINPWKRV